MLNELLVFILTVAASDPVMVISSAVAFPRVTAPLSVTAPAQVRADIDRSFVPSETPFKISVKF